MRGELAGPRVNKRRIQRIAATFFALLLSVAFAGCVGDGLDAQAQARALGCLEPTDIPADHGWVTLLVRRPFGVEKYGLITLKAKPMVIAWRGDVNTTGDYVSETEYSTMDWLEERKIWADVAVPAGSYKWIRITVDPESVEATNVEGFSVPVRVQSDRISVEPGTESGFFEVVEGRCMQIEVASLMEYDAGNYIIR